MWSGAIAQRVAERSTEMLMQVNNEAREPSASLKKARGASFTSWLAQFWSRRELMRLLVTLDLKRRYKRSVLGFFWTLLNPLITMIILSVVFSRIFAAFYKDYKLYMISGILLWNFFSAATQQGINSIVANGQLIRRVAVPKLIFPASVVASNFVNLVLSLVALGIFLPFVGATITIHLLWVPVMMPLLFGFTLGVVLIAATVNAFMRDLRNMWDAILLVWFFLTPVFYPRAVVDKYYFLLRLNPMLAIIEACRIPIYLGQMPPLGIFFKAALAAAVMLLSGIWIFRRYEARFFYYV